MHARTHTRTHPLTHSPTHPLTHSPTHSPTFAHARPHQNGGYFDAVSSTCGFEAGECFIAVFEPMGLLNHTCEWHLVDITDAETKVMHGTMPYAELEDMQPGEMPLELFEKNTVFTPGSRKER